MIVEKAILQQFISKLNDISLTIYIINAILEFKEAVIWRIPYVLQGLKT